MWHFCLDDGWLSLLLKKIHTCLDLKIFWEKQRRVERCKWSHLWTVSHTSPAETLLASSWEYRRNLTPNCPHQSKLNNIVLNLNSKLTRAAGFCYCLKWLYSIGPDQLAMQCHKIQIPGQNDSDALCMYSPKTWGMIIASSSRDWILWFLRIYGETIRNTFLVYAAVKPCNLCCNREEHVSVLEFHYITTETIHDVPYVAIISNSF